MNRFLFVFTFILITALARDSAAQSVTLYTAGPDGLAKGIAKSFTDKTAIKVDVYQATSGDVLARLEAEKAKPRADVVVLASWGEGLTVRQRGFVEVYSSPEAKEASAALVRRRPSRSGRRGAGADSEQQRSKNGSAAAILVRSRDAVLERCLDHARPDAFRQRRGVHRDLRRRSMATKRGNSLRSLRAMACRFRVRTTPRSTRS